MVVNTARSVPLTKSAREGQTMLLWQRVPHIVIMCHSITANLRISFLTLMRSGSYYYGYSFCIPQIFILRAFFNVHSSSAMAIERSNAKRNRAMRCSSALCILADALLHSQMASHFNFNTQSSAASSIHIFSLKNFFFLSSVQHSPFRVSTGICGNTQSMFNFQREPMEWRLWNYVFVERDAAKEWPNKILYWVRVHRYLNRYFLSSYAMVVHHLVTHLPRPGLQDGAVYSLIHCSQHTVDCFRYMRVHTFYGWFSRRCRVRRGQEKVCGGRGGGSV